MARSCVFIPRSKLAEVEAVVWLGVAVIQRRQACGGSGTTATERG